MNFSLLALSFTTVFMAEVGDKSSLAGIALCGTARHPRFIYLGLLCALVFSTLFAAVIGDEVSDVIPVQYVIGVAALGFAGLGIRMLLTSYDKNDRIHHSKAEKNTIRTSKENQIIEKIKAFFLPKGNAQGVAFGSTFLTVFLAQLGDLDQVTTILLSATSGDLWTVFFGASTAMIATSLVDFMVGRGLAIWISPKLLKRAAGVTLLIISISLFWNLAHGIVD